VRPRCRTIVFPLGKSFPLLPDALGKYAANLYAIMPERLARTDPFTTITEVVGSGPFGSRRMSVCLVRSTSTRDSKITIRARRTHLALDKDTPLHGPVQTVWRIASVTWFVGLHRQYVRLA
jgi:hypothetical protein